MTKRSDKIQAALERLADRFEYGHLQATTDPAGFLDTVCAELDRLRKADQPAATACHCPGCCSRGARACHLAEPRETPAPACDCPDAYQGVHVSPTCPVMGAARGTPACSHDWSFGRCDKCGVYWCDYDAARAKEVV